MGDRLCQNGPENCHNGRTFVVFSASNNASTMGVTSFYGAWCKKQVWHLRVRTEPEVFRKQMYTVLKRVLVTLLGLFQIPLSHSAPPGVFRCIFSVFVAHLLYNCLGVFSPSAKVAAGRNDG